MQNLCIPATAETAKPTTDSPPSAEGSEAEASPTDGENEDADIAAAVTITNVKYGRSKSTSGADNLKERLQTLQWKTFDLQRQNELLRRMLEIQSTVNENAAKVATEKVSPVAQWQHHGVGGGGRHFSGGGRD